MSKARRGTAIVETDQGILLTAINKIFLLPGGRAEPGESRYKAAVRELEEETGLIAKTSEIIFKHESYSNKHTVVLIKAEGIPVPSQEVRYIDYFVPGKIINMSKGTKDILEKYFQWKNENFLTE